MREEKIEEGSFWQHFKGDIMKVVALANHSENLEIMVVYEHAGELWVRPMSSFLSSEDVSSRGDNVTGQKYRFVEVKERENEKC